MYIQGNTRVRMLQSYTVTYSVHMRSAGACTCEQYKNAVHYQTVHVPNHLRLGSTLATSPLLTLVWNGAGRSTFP